MSSKFGQMGPLFSMATDRVHWTMELAALERLKKNPIDL